MKRRGKIVQQWDMEGLDKYDANGVFEDTMKGKFTQLNKEEENAKAEKQAYEVIETNLQPKAKKVAKQREPSRQKGKPEVVMGKKLPSLKYMDAEKAEGY